MASYEEQETTVTFVKADGYVLIYSAVPRHVNRLRRDDRAEEVRGGTDWGEFKIPASAFDPLTGFKARRKPLSEEERARRSEQAKKNLAQRSNS